MDTLISHILVPVDYSDKSIYGLEMANNLAQKIGGKITVISVLKGVDPIWSDFFSDDERDRLLDKLKRHLHNFSMKHLTSKGIETDFIIAKGKLCETILETAEELQVTSIVMGTSTVDNIKKWIIGTNALRIVSEATCPVITLKDHPKKESIERIILPLDLAKETREKTVEAVEIALKFNAEIHVVSAQTYNDDLITKKLNTQLDQVIDYIKKHNVTCTGRILKVKDRVDGIVDFINQKEGDLIILTTHQQLDLVDSFIGSIAKDIMRSVDVPVMSIVPSLSHYFAFDMPGFH